MKTLKFIFLLSLATLFFACEKEQIEPELPDIEVKYFLLGTDEKAELHQVRFLDENQIWQTVDNPSLDWKYEMTVPRGFVAEIEMDGFIPKVAPPFIRANVRLKGNGYGCWSASHSTEVPGEFTIHTAYEMGEAE